MTSRNLMKSELRRLRLVWLIMLAALGLLLLLLGRMQLGYGEHYENDLERQSIRRIQVPGPRGRIFDRQGACLADNRPDYCLALYLEELRRPGQRRITSAEAWQSIQDTAAIIGQPPNITRSQLESHLYNRKALPLIAWRHLNALGLAKLSEGSLFMPMAEILVNAERVYPAGASAAHLLGYVGVAEPDEDGRGYYSYWPEIAGKSGLEKRYDDLLRGAAGGRLVRVDVTGFKHAEIGFREPIPGGDLILSIDLAIQRSAERALDGVAGAVVIIDPRNGDVLALASSPGFDPNAFSPSISRRLWDQIINDARRPLFNRAISGLYAPGSIFKPLVALAALESAKISPQSTITCSGYSVVGGQRFSCFEGEQHGRINLRAAIAMSCNVFFYQLGLLCGLDPIYHQALAMGLGQKTGIDLDYEAAGLLPGKAWKRIARGEGWWDGDTCNLAIGQGALLVTPLQMAAAIAAIANGGTLYQPRLILSVRARNSAEFSPIAPVPVRVLSWQPEHLRLVQEGMRDVIQEPFGTGHAVCLPGVVMAGKTGTAEYGRKGSGQRRGWLVLFAPYEQPRYAVAMLMDDAISGGATVGPRLRQLMDEILKFTGDAS